MATTISRATWVDDDGSGMTGTVINNARLQQDIYDKIDLLFSGAGGIVLNSGLTAASVNALNAVTDFGRSVGMGVWTSVPYSAGNFTASGAMTWTVDSADVASMQYMLIGKTVFLLFNLQSTTLAGTAGTTLFIQWPAACNAFQQDVTPAARLTQGATGISLVAYTAPASAQIGLIPVASSNLPLGTNNIVVQGEMFYRGA